jgi:hypothetical protein
MVRVNLLTPMRTVGNMYAWANEIVLDGRTWFSLEVRHAPWLKGTTTGEYEVRLVKGYITTRFN